MRTCKSRQVTESPGDEGVGSTLISVAVGCGKGIGLAGAAEDSPVEEQAVKMNSPINRILGGFFMGSIGIHPILIRRIVLPASPNGNRSGFSKKRVENSTRFVSRLYE